MNPPLDYVDRPLAQRVAQSLDELVHDIRADIAKDPAKLRQTREAILADNLTMIAAYRYALAQPLKSVMDALREAAEHKLEVFKIRGTDPAFPVFHDSDAGVFGESDGADWSLTNPRQGLEGMLLAASTGHVLLSRRIAQLVGHPSDAAYIGEDSEVCTPDDQHLALGFKYYLLGQTDRARDELLSVSSRRVHDAELVAALSDRDGDALVSTLRRKLESHAKEAEKKKNRKDPTLFLALLPLAVTVLAVVDGIVQLDRLSSLDSPHYPVDLVRAAVVKDLDRAE